MSQADYGGPELVPSGLRVYRHYKLKGYELTATITTDEKVRPGVNLAQCHANVSGNPFRPYGGGCGKCGGYGFLRRMRPKVKPFQFNAADSAETIDVEIYDEVCECQRGRARCRTPELRCTCGFYASYDPTHNFFTEVMTNNSAWLYNLPPVFAVVEASGRVLMGSKGVRAERMEVKAIALDMEHINHGLPGTSPAMRYFMQTNEPSSDEEYVRNILRTTQGTRLSRELDRVATWYGVPNFGDDIDAMIEAFPQPDLSGLIENQEK